LPPRGARAIELIFNIVEQVARFLDDCALIRLQCSLAIFSAHSQPPNLAPILNTIRELRDGLDFRESDSCHGAVQER
jgi:hypothetical protein